MKVDVYNPNPLRCFRCQRHGHHDKGHVSENLHVLNVVRQDKQCKQKPQCVNCDRNHGSFSPDCTLWKKEKNIQTVKVTQGISFPEARKAIVQRGSIHTSAISYSDVAGVKKSSVACQTDMTWPLGALQPSQMPKQKRPVVKAVSTITVVNTPATKSRPQPQKGIPHHLLQWLNPYSSDSFLKKEV